MVEPYPEGINTVAPATYTPPPRDAPLGSPFFDSVWSKLQGKPYVTVSAKGIANGLSDIPNDGADFGPDTLGTQTSGIQEAINYVTSIGGSEIKIKGGTYNITNTGQASIQIPFNVPIKIEGEGKGITILKAPIGFFALMSGNTQNSAPVEISNMTLKTTEASSSSGGYFLIGSSTYGWANIYIHDMDMYGGGNVGTGVFNLGFFNGVEGGTPMTNVYLKNLYIDTLGTTNGNEAMTFPLIYGDNFVLDNITTINTLGPGIGFFNVYGGVIIVKNIKTNPAGGYFNSRPYSTTPSVTTTNLFTRLIFENCIFDSTWSSGTQSGFAPIDIIVNNSTVTNDANPFSGEGATPTYHSISFNNITVGEEYNTLMSGFTAESIIIHGLNLLNNNNLDSSAQPIFSACLPYQSMNIYFELDGYIGYPSNQNTTIISIPTNTTSVTATYTLKLNFAGYNTSYGLGSTTYSDPNGLRSMVLANPSYFTKVDYRMLNLSQNTMEEFHYGNTVTTPTVPASGTAQQNTNPYPVKVYINGGAITEIQITIGGTSYTVYSNSTASAVYENFTLPAGASITLTYTTAPTWTWVPE